MDWERPLQLASGRRLATGERALIVAEIGQNHNGRFDWAEQLVDAAAWAGADAVKFVKRDLECELSRDAAALPYNEPQSFGATYGEHRRALELSLEEHSRLSERARAHGVLYFATVCDPPSAQAIEGLGVELFKVASRDLANAPLIEFLATRNKPLLMSTGMSDLGEIDRAVGTLRRNRTSFALMQCTSLYPTDPQAANLRSMATLRKRFRVPVGFSDHTSGGLLSPVAVALGACVIEKHLTLDRTARGTDHRCSLEPVDFARLVSEIRTVEQALGRPDKPVAQGVEVVRARVGRSLVVSRSLEAGTQLEESMLELKCPGDGLSWQERQLVVGRKLRRSLDANQKLSLSDVE